MSASEWCVSAMPGPIVLFHMSMSVAPLMSLLILLLQEVLNMALLLVRMIRTLHLISTITLSEFGVLQVIKSARCGVFKEQKLDDVDLLSGLGINLSFGSDMQKLLDAFH